MSKTPIIEMENVGIRYGRGPEILSNINLSLERGSFHYLTGKSGAGKTSLLSMMYLAQKPSRGNVSVFGNNVNFANRNSLAMFRRRIGVVFQDFRLLEHSSAFDNVALPLRVCGMNEKEIRKRVNELLKWVEIDRSTSAAVVICARLVETMTPYWPSAESRPTHICMVEPTFTIWYSSPFWNSFCRS